MGALWRHDFNTERFHESGGFDMSIFLIVSRRVGCQRRGQAASRRRSSGGVQEGHAGHPDRRNTMTAGSGIDRSAAADRDTETIAVDLRGVHKSFGSVEAVRGVDLTIRSGEVMAFLGPNGAGKTSTIDMILGLSHPASGRCRGLRHGAAAGGHQGPGLRRHAGRGTAQGPHRAETVQYTVQPVRRQPPGRGGAGAGRHHRASRTAWSESAQEENSSGSALPWR